MVKFQISDVPDFDRPLHEEVENKEELEKLLDREVKRRWDRCKEKGWIERTPKGPYWRFLLRYKRAMQRGNMDFTMASLGLRGTGKSTKILLTGMFWDEDFLPDTLEHRLLYDQEDMDTFYSNSFGDSPRWCYGVWDEGGESFNAFDANTRKARNISAMMTVIRDGYNRFIELNAPYFKSINRFFRADEVQALTRADMQYDLVTGELIKGQLYFWSKKRMYQISQTPQGLLLFPKPNFSSVFPPVGGKMWDEYKKISGEKKRALVRKRIDQASGRTEEEIFEVA